MYVYRLESWAGGQRRLESPSCDDTFAIQVEGRGQLRTPRSSPPIRAAASYSLEAASRAAGQMAGLK